MKKFIFIWMALVLYLNIQAQVIPAAGDKDSSLLRIQALEAQVQSLSAENRSTKSKWAKVQLGLSFGFNFYTNGQKRYYVTADSTAASYGKTEGVSAVLSGLIGYRIKPEHSVFLNIPLKDLYADPNQAIGIFNQRIAGGLGYGYNIEQLSFILIFNVMPYEQVIDDVLGAKKFSQEPYSVIQAEELPTVTAYSPSLTLGISYNLLGNRKTGLFEP